MNDFLASQATFRDHAALAMLQAIVEHDGIGKDKSVDAIQAYKYADALLGAREKSSAPTKTEPNSPVGFVTPDDRR